MAEVIKEFALANIARVDITTEEDVPKTYTLTDVATEAEVIAYLSEGEEKELRVKNVIKAQNKTADIVMGYDINLIQATMIPEILALIDGGTYDEATKKYSAPPIGTAVERTRFKLSIYTEEKDGDGSTLNYVKFTYNNCEGSPVNYTLQDGEFFVPEMPAKSRPKMGQSPVEFEILTELPA